LSGHDGAVHDGVVHDGAVHDGAVHDGAVHDGAVWSRDTLDSMRWVAIVVLAGCFSKPGLQGRDGGGDGDGGGGDGGGSGDGGMTDGGTFDGPLTGCTWNVLGPILDGALDERHPWISPDGRMVTFWSGEAPGSTGTIMQARRNSVDEPFGVVAQVYPQSGTTAPAEADPALDASELKMYLHTSNSIHSGMRAMENGVFQNVAPDGQLTMLMQTRQVQEGPFITSDGLTFLFVAGESADPYNTEDLYIARRNSVGLAFSAPQPYPHNVTGKNEGAPTMAGNVLMYERPSTLGKTEIVSSIWNAATSQYSPPELVVLAGSDSFKQPSLSTVGRLVYGVGVGNDYHIEEAKLECPP
jgi:hypothetical protein